jgi:hypothetical protein
MNELIYKAVKSKYCKCLRFSEISAHASFILSLFNLMQLQIFILIKKQKKVPRESQGKCCRGVRYRDISEPRTYNPSSVILVHLEISYTETNCIYHSKLRLSCCRRVRFFAILMQRVLNQYLLSGYS